VSRHLYQLISCWIFLFSGIVNAQWITLECNPRDAKGQEFTMYFNESTNSVYMLQSFASGEEAYDISFTPFVIKFTFKEKNIKGGFDRRIYRVNRKFGNVNVSTADDDNFVWQSWCMRGELNRVLF